MIKRIHSRLGLAAMIALLIITAAPSAKADGVEYQATIVSGNEWQYAYTLTGTPLNANQGLTVFFDPALTLNLTNASLDAINPASVAATAWSSFTIPYDPTLSSDGYYTALALINADTTADGFAVDFNYLGSGSPGSQAFSIDQYDANGNLISNLQTGETTPLTTVATPEPGTGSLLILGAFVVVMAMFWRLRNSGSTQRQHPEFV